MKEKLAFLFGSGTSLPARVASTSQITERVLTGTDVSRHSDETYYFGKPMYGMTDEYVPKVVSFIRRLKTEIDNYYSFHSNRETNYEDIYSVAIQLHDSESGEFDNPSVAALVEKIRSDSWHVLVGRPLLETSDWRIIDITSEATNYIADVVWHMLATAPGDLSYLGFLKECLLDDRFDGADVFTLNHDTILESYFEAFAVRFIDGFDNPSDNVRYWNPSNFEPANNNQVRLFKLHGSINWFRFEDRPSLTLGIPLKDFWKSGSRDYPPKGRPEMLIGTHNKILLYSGPIYVDLHSLFYRYLQATNTLVISGYSFNDKVINTRVIYWLSSNPKNKIILVHPNLKNLKISARPAIARQLDLWRDQKKLSLVEKRVEATLWSDIVAGLS